MKKLIGLLFAANFLFLVSQSSSQWSEQSTGVSSKLNGCRVFTYDNTWICGDNGTVLRTTNNGLNWINLTGNGIPLNVNLISIGGLNDNAVTIGGNNPSGSVIYMSSNSGVNWFQVFSQPGGMFRSLSTKMYIGDPVGGRWSIWRSNNYGLTWDSSGQYLPQNNSEHGWNNSYSSDPDDYNFVFGTSNYRLYKRFNTTWTTITLTEQNIYSVNWSYTQMGYVGGANLLKTTNAGITWTQESLPGSGNIISMASQPGHQLNFAVRQNNEIYYKTYNSSWTYDYTSPSGSYEFLRVGGSMTNLYAIRSNGVVSKKTISPPPLGINQVSQEIPEQFLLTQNYPNPFNPTTKIKFDISHQSYAKIIIYDVIGKEVRALINQQFSPGSYEIDFDGSSLPSGVYYYKLEAGSFTETRKMVLIK
jgi:photosystem II stability/assembly factor-like uncharacterized protein